MRGAAASPLASRISYSQVWEDEAVLLAAVRPGPGECVLSIASAGDNAIALALAGARVTAIDLSFPQLALAELKLAAGALPYEEYLAFLGLHPCATREVSYRRAVRPALSDAARAFWDCRLSMIRRGVLHTGRLERFFEAFRRFLLPSIHRASTVRALLSLGDLEAQREFFRKRWNTAAWRYSFRLFFSRTVIALFGRSRAQFAHVQGAVADVLLARVERALTRVPIATNPYLEWILRGAYRDPARARAYLSPEGHAGLSRARERIRFIHAELGEHLRTTDQSYDAFNYSDLFEYVSADAHAELLKLTLAAARPGARIAYWNLFVPRARPESLAERLHRRQEEAAALHEMDRAFLYGAFQLEVAQ
jgi:S-adenosylmethionine-diacylglycerol 3-amino-3-carboxypropyl transferase